MPNKKVSKTENSLNRKPFITFDDALAIVPRLEKLAHILKELGERKHPLAIRKGVMPTMTKPDKSVQVKGSGSTYFLDIHQAKTGNSYLKITQSRKAEGDEFERSSIFIFPEDASEFGEKVIEMLKAIA